MSKKSKSQKDRESPGEPGRARTESPGETGLPAFSPRALRDRRGKTGNPVFSPRALHISYRSAPSTKQRCTCKCTYIHRRHASKTENHFSYICHHGDGRCIGARGARCVCLAEWVPPVGGAPSRRTTPPDREPQTSPQGISTGPVTANQKRSR